MAGIYQAVEQNLYNRQLLLNTAIPQNKTVGIYNLSIGENKRIELLPLGIITRLRLFFSAKLKGTKPDTGNLVFTTNKKYPWALVRNIKLKDYDNTDRINLSGFMLAKLNEVRYSQVEGSSVWRKIYDYPVIPQGGTFNSNIERQLKFLLDIPLAYEPESDLRGALIGQTTAGKLYLELEITDNIVGTGDDYLFTVSSGTVKLEDIQVKVEQEFYYVYPVQGKFPIPILDLSTMYYLHGNIHTSDNIIAGTEKFIDYEPAISVLGLYFAYMNNGVLTDNDFEKIRIVIDKTNTIREWDLDYYKISTRHKLLFDLESGVYWIDHRRQPVETVRYGVYQLGIKFKDDATFTNPDFEILWEAMKPKPIQVNIAT